MIEQGWDQIKKVMTKFLLDKLDLFIQAKSSFGIGDNLGLGSLPWLHFPNTWLRLIPLQRRNWLFAKALPRPINIRRRKAIIVVKPDDAIVSVYPRPTSMGLGGNIDFDNRFLNIPDEALIGGYAHECAAYQIYWNNIPERFRHVLTGITDRQKSEDALAAAHGYKDELICLLETHLKLLVFEAKPRHGWFIRGSLSIKEELEDRIAFLTYL